MSPANCRFRSLTYKRISGHMYMDDSDVQLHTLSADTFASISLFLMVSLSSPIRISANRWSSQSKAVFDRSSAVEFTGTLGVPSASTGAFTIASNLEPFDSEGWRAAAFVEEVAVRVLPEEGGGDVDACCSGAAETMRNTNKRLAQQMP